MHTELQLLKPDQYTTLVYEQFNTVQQRIGFNCKVVEYLLLVPNKSFGHETLKTQKLNKTNAVYTRAVI